MINELNRAEYFELIKSKKLHAQQVKVFEVIYNNGGLTRKEVAQFAQLPISSICGRVKELKDLGLVYEDGIKQRSTKLYAGINNLNYWQRRDIDKRVFNTLFNKVLKMLSRYPAWKQDILNKLNY